MNKDGSTANKWKMITLERVKFKSNLNGVLEEIAGYRDVDWHCHCWRDSRFDPKELSESSRININKERALTLWQEFLKVVE